MNTTGGSVFGGGNYEFFGLPSNSNVFTYDGANDNDPYFNINNSGATNLTLGLNDVQETSVVTNGYSGQFGGLAGANINYVSKSGTNSFHGNAEYWWNGRALNSNNYFRNQANAIIETHFTGLTGSEKPENGERRLAELVAPHVDWLVDVGANDGDWARTFLQGAPRRTAPSGPDRTSEQRASKSSKPRCPTGKADRSSS